MSQPSQRTISGHYRPASEMPLEWNGFFAGGTMVNRHHVLIGRLIRQTIYGMHSKMSRGM